MTIHHDASTIREGCFYSEEKSLSSGVKIFEEKRAGVWVMNCCSLWENPYNAIEKGLPFRAAPKARAVKEFISGLAFKKY